MEKMNITSRSLPILPQNTRTVASSARKVQGPEEGSDHCRNSARSTGSIPMEGTFLYVKNIDNSSVDYCYSPMNMNNIRCMFSQGLFCVLMMFLWIGPQLWVRHSGYRISQLNIRIEQEAVVRDEFKVQLGSLGDLGRIAGLAENKGLVETDPTQVAWFGLRPLELEPNREVAQLWTPME